MGGEERRRLGDELDKTNHQLYRGCVKSRKWYAPKGQKLIAQGSALGNDGYKPVAL